MRKLKESEKVLCWGFSLALQLYTYIYPMCKEQSLIFAYDFNYIIKRKKIISLCNFLTSMMCYSC